MKLRAVARRVYNYRTLLLMLAPAVVFTFIFAYVPMGGIITAFKQYNYSLGIFGSPWVGFQNFRFFFMTGQAARVTLNTVMYNVGFISLGTFASVMLAVFLSEMVSLRYKKTMQTLMFLPHFISWVIVGAIVYNFLSTEYGVLNTVRKSMGMQPFSAYVTPSFWPGFIQGLNLWKGAGYGSVVYLAVITGIDQQIYEAAKIDGANIFQRMRHITFPGLRPMITLQLLFSVSGIFRGSFSMFYNIIGTNSILYPTTDVIDTVVFRALLSSSNLGMSASIGVFQSVLCFITIMLTNYVIRRVEPDHALF